MINYIERAKEICSSSAHSKIAYRNQFCLEIEKVSRQPIWDTGYSSKEPYSRGVYVPWRTLPKHVKFSTCRCLTGVLRNSLEGLTLRQASVPGRFLFPGLAWGSSCFV